MEELKHLIKTTGIYFLGTVGTKLINFLLLPLYTAYLLPSQYGRYDVNITYAILFSSVCFLNIWVGIMKHMFEYRDDVRQRTVVYSGVVIFFISSVIYLISMSFFESIMGIEYRLGVTTYGFFLCLQELYGYLARAYGKNLLFILTGLASTTCNAALNILLLTVFRWDYKALYVSYATGVLIQCITLETKMHIISRFSRRYIDKTMIKSLLRFSFPLCITSLCYWMLTGYNKIIIEKHIDAAANGYYAVASKLGGILILASSCFSMAWQELAYRKYDKDKSTGQFYSYATNIYIKILFGGFFIVLPIIYFAFPYLVDDGYEAAKRMVPINMLATLAGILFIFLGNIISTYKKNSFLFLSTLAASIVNVIVLHILVGKAGAEAANYALLTGYVVSDAIRIRMIASLIDYHLDWNMFLYLIPFTGIILFVYWHGQKRDNLILVLASMAVCIWILWPIVKLCCGYIKKRSL